MCVLKTCANLSFLLRQGYGGQACVMRIEYCVFELKTQWNIYLWHKWDTECLWTWLGCVGGIRERGEATLGGMEYSC